MPGKNLPSDVEIEKIVADQRREIARLRRAVSSLGGGSFDPNENPVIIGASATAGGSSSPNDVSTGFTDAVVIGNVAAADASECTVVGAAAAADVDAAVVVGYGAHARDQSDVCVGPAAVTGTNISGIGERVSIGSSASADYLRSVAVGSFAAASADHAVALGGATVASGTRSLAVGRQANATHANASAIGNGATTTATHQVMLGTSSDTVVLPGSLDVTALPTSDPGISGLVWNNGGVLTVSP